MSEIDLSSFLAARIRGAGADLEKARAKMPADRQSWHPEVEGNIGRDALDQMIECGMLNGFLAGGFRTGEVPNPDWDVYATEKAKLDSAEKVMAAFKEGTAALASAVEACPAARLAETFTDPFFNKEINWAEFALFLYWNMCYHEGQINYIQVLYGDKS